MITNFGESREISSKPPLKEGFCKDSNFEILFGGINDHFSKREHNFHDYFGNKQLKPSTKLLYTILTN